jgi:hypothetical protein
VLVVLVVVFVDAVVDVLFLTQCYDAKIQVDYHVISYHIT